MSKISTQILAVDDDRGYLEYTSNYLTEQGFKVHCATNGASMRKILDAHSIDLVLLDLSMPGEDGPQRQERRRYRAKFGYRGMCGTEIGRAKPTQIG